MCKHASTCDIIETVTILRCKSHLCKILQHLQSGHSRVFQLGHACILTGSSHFQHSEHHLEIFGLCQLQNTHHCKIQILHRGVKI